MAHVGGDKERVGEDLVVAGRAEGLEVVGRGRRCEEMDERGE